MGGAAAVVDVHAVGVLVDEVGVGLEPAEQLRRGGAGGAVGAVHQDVEPRQVALNGGGHEIDIVPLQLAHAVVAAADLAPGAELHGLPGENFLLNAGLHGVGELVALAAEDLDAVVLVGVVAGGDDDAGVGLLLPGQIRHRRSGDGAHRLHIAAHGADARHQGGLQHIGGHTGILADEDHGTAALVLHEDGGHRLAHPVGKVRGQVLAHDAADAVCTK